MSSVDPSSPVPLDASGAGVWATVLQPVGELASLPAGRSATSPFDDLTGLPFEDPILVFALAVTCFLVAPLVMERYRLPGIVGIILVGALVGPNALGLLERGETIVLLGNVGLVYLMFLAGLEIDLAEFRRNRSRSAGFGLLSFAIPQAVGTLVGVHLLGFGWATALLFASVFASHTLLAYPVVTRFGVGDNRAVTTAIGGTILTDTLALLVLAVVAAAAVGDLTPGFWVQLGVGLTVFFVGTWLLVPRVGRWFFRTVNEESYVEYLFVLAVAFIAAYAAELAGVEAIIGAFLAGLALNPLVPSHGVLMNRTEFVGNAIFIPFFLLSIGMLVDVAVLLDGPATLVIAAALVAMTLATKLGAAATAGWLYDYTPAEVGAVFGLSVGQAAAALAVTLVGFEIGLFDDAVVNAVILLILVISVVAPAATERSARRIAMAADRDYEPGDLPRRVLLPFSRGSEQRESLLDVAILLRDPAAGEPIYAVTVVRPDAGDGDVDAAVAEAEAIHDASSAYAAGAEVSVVSQTRLNHNVASGIAAAATETRASTIVIGWDGASSRTQSTFGTVIDRVLQNTLQQVVVTRVREPLNLTGRVVVVLPPTVEHNAGVHETVHAVKTLASELDAPVDAHVVREGGDGSDERPAHAPDQSIADRYRSLFGSVAPEAPFTVHEIDGWDAVDELLERVTVDDLVVVVSARRGHLGWHPELRTLPKRVATTAPGNFAVVYVPVVRDRDDRRFLRMR